MNPVWFQSYSGVALSLKPGELVRFPSHDRGTKLAWALAKDVAKIEKAEGSDKPGSNVDAEMLKLLTFASTTKVGMNDVRDFEFRERKSNIVFQTPDIYAHISERDLEGHKALKKLGIAGVAQWMLAHGARKMKNQKRRRTLPYYD